MEEALTTTQDMLIQFIISLPAPEQYMMSQEAQLIFLKDIDALKSHLTNVIGDEDDQEEEEEDKTHTVINGGL